MSLFLYYSISSNFTEDEITEIDKQVAKNREAVFLFTRKLPSNLKVKAKKLMLYGTFVLSTVQPLAPYAYSVMLPVPPMASSRLSPIEQHKILNNKNDYIQIAHIPLSKIDKIKLTNDQIQQVNTLVLQLDTGSMEIEELILQLRGGDGVIDIVALIAVIIFLNWSDSVWGVEGFQTTPLPHQDPFGWFIGKYDSKKGNNGQCSSHAPSRFERETLHTINQMCAASADEDGFVMTKDEAYDLIKETYGGYMQINEDCKISDWQGVKKAYHFQKGFDIDLSKYPSISKEDLVALQNSDGGLIKYVQRGGKLPPIEFIKDSQQKVYDFCHLENTEIKLDAKHYGKDTGETPCTMFFNRETQQIALFNQTSGDLITADKFRDKYFTRCINSGQFGNPKK
jgi:hypothetical protein